MLNDAERTDALLANLFDAVAGVVGDVAIHDGIGPAATVTASPLAVTLRDAAGIVRQFPGDPTLADALTAFLNDGAARIRPADRKAIGEALDSGRVSLAVVLDLEGGAQAVIVGPEGTTPVWLFTLSLPVARN